MKKKNKKIYFLVEARVNSSRLKNKVLKKINKNHLTIDYVIKNILSSGILKDKIIVLTPKNKINSKLQKHVKKKYGCKIFKGSASNVFKRVYDCCNSFNISHFARITADNIFLDPIFIKRTTNLFLLDKSSYLSSRTMDHSKRWKEKSDYNEGTSIEFLNLNFFKKIKNLVNKSNQEYPTWNIFSNPQKFKLKKIDLIKEYKGLDIKKIRTTLDTKKDLKFLRSVSKKLNLVPGKNNLLKILKNQHIFALNKINQKVHKKIAYKIVQKSQKK
mgnify:CR=1 FL=1